jgi:hypothetical protein
MERPTFSESSDAPENAAKINEVQLLSPARPKPEVLLTTPCGLSVPTVALSRLRLR